MIQTFTLEGRFNFQMDLDPTFRADQHFLEQGVHYEADITHVLLRTLKPGDHAVDAGANVGYFSMMMAGTLLPHCKSRLSVVRTTLHCKLRDYTAQYGPRQHTLSHLMQCTARRVAFITCHGACGRHQMLKHTPNDASKVSAALACAGSPSFQP